MGGQLQDFCATDGNDGMSSGRFYVSQSIRIDFEMFISLPIVFVFKLLLYLSLLYDVFALCTMRLLGRADVPSARLLKR